MLKAMKKALALVLVMLMIFGLVPTELCTVFGETGQGNSASMIGTEINFYLGNYNGNNLEWTVINSTNNELTVLLNDVLKDSDGVSDLKCNFDTNNSSNQYLGSSIQEFLQTYLDPIFMSAKQQGALIPITTDATGQSNATQNGDGQPHYTYLLSKSDYENSVSLIQPLPDCEWWLSTAATNSTDEETYVDIVESDGSIGSLRPNNQGALAKIRPALKLDRTKIADLTLATDLQSQLNRPGMLTNLDALSGEKKLALIDSSNSTTLTIDSVYTPDGLTKNTPITINYSNATTGSCNGIRVRLKSNGTGNIYYGVISQLSQVSGQAIFNLPEDISDGYEMSIWNEQFNPEYSTNVTSLVTTYISGNNPIQTIIPTSDWYNFRATRNTDYSIAINPSITATQAGYSTIAAEGDPTSTFSSQYILTSPSGNLSDIENTTVNLQFLNDSATLLTQPIQINLGSIINNLELDVEGTTDPHFMQKFRIADNSIGLRDWKIVDNNSVVVDSKSYKLKVESVYNDLIQWPMTIVDGLSCINDVLYKFIVTNNAGISSFAPFRLQAPDLAFFDVVFNNDFEYMDSREDGSVIVGYNGDNVKFIPRNLLYQIALDDGSGIFNWSDSVVYSTEDTLEQTIYLRFKDENGNISCPSCPITVIYDDVAPTITGVANGDNTKVGYNISWEDLQSGIYSWCLSYTLNDGESSEGDEIYNQPGIPSNIYVNKPGDYQIVVRDNVGNSNTIEFTVYAPEYSITPSLPESEWYNSNVTISSDNSDYKIYVDFSKGNNTPPTADSVTWRDQVVVEAEGSNCGLLYFKDSDGNVSAPVVLDPINIDKTSPNDMDIKISQDNGQTYTSIYNKIGKFIDGPGWFFKDCATVKIQVNDPKPTVIGGKVENAIASGISIIESYITNTLNTQDTTTMAESVFTVLKNFVGTIKSIATDGAGNSTSITSGTFVVADGNFNPEITLTNGVNTCFRQGINLNAGISGLNQYTLYNAEDDTTLATYAYDEYTVNDYFTVDQPGQYKLTVTNNIDNKTVVDFNITVPDNTWYKITPEKDTYGCYNSAITITSTKTSSDSTPYAIKRDGGEWVNPSTDPLTGKVVPPSITINPEDPVPVYLYFMDTKNIDNITFPTEPIMLKFALPVKMAQLNAKLNATAVVGLKNIALNNTPPTSFNTFYFEHVGNGVIINPGNIVSGVKKCTYRFIDDHGNAGEICDDGSIKLPDTKGDFVGYLEVNVTYDVGDAMTMYSQGFTIDVTPPQITGVVDGQSHNSGSTISWSDSGSGVAKINLDGVDLDIGIVSKGSIYVDSVGQHQIYAVDNVGNASQVINFAILPQQLESQLPRLSHPQNSPFVPILIAVLGVLVGGGIIGVVILRKKGNKKDK